MERVFHARLRWALGVMPCALALAGCAQLLGGLDDGNPQTIEPVDGGDVPDVAPRAVPQRSDWLAGFGYRIAYEVNSAEPAPLVGYSLPLALDTHSAIRARKMRENGADIRVTAPDGLTVLPHWVASSLNAEATTLWTKVDLTPGRNVVFVYYGNDAAEQTANLRATFVDGIIANPTFEGTAPWVATPPTNGELGLLHMQEQQASVTLTREPSDVPSSLGWCQSVTFPPGRRYRIVFDLTAARADLCEVSIWTGGVGGTSLWTDRGGAGRQRGIATGPLDPGPTKLCIGGTTFASTLPQNLSVNFQNLRVRLHAATEPLADLPGPEERR